MSKQPPNQELVAKDLHANAWRFRHIFRGDCCIRFCYLLLFVTRTDHTNVCLYACLDYCCMILFSETCNSPLEKFYLVSEKDNNVVVVKVMRCSPVLLKSIVLILMTHLHTKFEAIIHGNFAIEFARDCSPPLVPLTSAIGYLILLRSGLAYGYTTKGNYHLLGSMVAN